MPKTIVTGANGYIGQHIVKQLLEKNYTVVGTVRSEEKGEQLVKDFVGDFSYEVIEDFVNPRAFDKILQKHSDAVGFFHNASPAIFVNDEEKVILPAIEGTKNLLESAHEYSKDLKKFIYTSSMASILSKEQTKDSIITEETWNQIGRYDSTNGVDAYFISKTFAEKALWEFRKTKNPRFAVNAINPDYVFGPQAFDSGIKDTLNGSAEIVNSLLKLKPNDPIPEMASRCIDVRDVARAHIYLFEEDVSDQRIILSDEAFASQLVLDLIHKNFPELDYLPKGNPSTTAKVLEELPKVDSTKSKAMVGPYISMEQSIIETVKQVLDNKPTA